MLNFSIKIKRGDRGGTRGILRRDIFGSLAVDALVLEEEVTLDLVGSLSLEAARLGWRLDRSIAVDSMGLLLL